MNNYHENHSNKNDNNKNNNNNAHYLYKENNNIKDMKLSNN